MDVSKLLTQKLGRRQLLAGLGLVGAGVAAGVRPNSAGAVRPTAAEQSVLVNLPDSALLNFALNLEYLEAEYYLRAVGRTLIAADIGPNPGTVTGGTQVTFVTPALEDFAEELADDEEAHVRILRSLLGSAAVGRPVIDFTEGFNMVARAAGIVGPQDTFDAFASEENFILGSFLFEDVGATAYRGAAPYIKNREYVSVAAGILAVEGYHAGAVRTIVYNMGADARDDAQAISDARDAVDGAVDEDQGVDVGGTANIVPTNANGLVLNRTSSQVLRIVYVTPQTGVIGGGFFPNGVRGTVRRT